MDWILRIRPAGEWLGSPKSLNEDSDMFAEWLSCVTADCGVEGNIATLTERNTWSRDQSCYGLVRTFRGESRDTWPTQVIFLIRIKYVQ